jgi:hypothetical protein
MVGRDLTQASRFSTCHSWHLTAAPAVWVVVLVLSAVPSHGRVVALFAGPQPTPLPLMKPSVPPLLEKKAQTMHRL